MSEQLRQWVQDQNNKFIRHCDKTVKHSVDISYVGTPFHSNSGGTPGHETLEEK